MQIQAIETQYLGYKFRSRLQARWAVFFHAAGIPFEYQPEGFKLESGYYLPDFYLPWFKCYVQIKHKYYDGIEAAKEKLAQLYGHLWNAYGWPEAHVMLCCGDPYDFDAYLYSFMYNDSSAGSIWVDSKKDKLDFYEGLQWDWGGHSRHKIIIGFDIGHGYTPLPNDCDTKELSDYTYYMRNHIETLPSHACVEDIRGFTYCRSKLQTAKLRARQARFQHGEKP